MKLDLTPEAAAGVDALGELRRIANDPDKVIEFCEHAGIIANVHTAIELASQCFATERMTCGLMQDHETDDQWIVLRIRVRGLPADVLSAKKQYTTQWVTRVPSSKRDFVRLSYEIV